jgi:hypothetical protein
MLDAIREESLADTPPCESGKNEVDDQSSGDGK